MKVQREDRDGKRERREVCRADFEFRFDGTKIMVEEE
jgi:hypothetical protein